MLYNPEVQEQHYQAIQRARLSERFDANETAFLERQLTQLRAKLFEVVHTENRARSFMPFATDIAESVEQYSYQVYDYSGEAAVVNLSAGAKDIPHIGLSSFEVTGKVYDIADFYDWSINELAEAARTGVDISSRKAMAAKQVIENSIDMMLAFGRPNDRQTNLVTTGLINNQAVTDLGIVNPANDAWVAGTTTADQIISDPNLIVEPIFTASKGLFGADTLLLPQREYLIASKTRIANTNETALSYFLRTNPTVRNIDSWHRLTLAGAGGTTSRAIAYKRDPMVLEGVLPMDFRTLPPQASQFRFEVYCQARCGGVKVYQPIAMKYADFAQP
jgi:hypothetical protein